MTLRLEPLLKEQFNDADTTPVSATKLKAFIDNLSEKEGFKFEYGDPCLEKDDWVLDILTNQEYVARLKKIVED